MRAASTRGPPLARGPAGASACRVSRGRGRRASARAPASAASAAAFPAEAAPLLEEQVGAVAEACGLRSGRLDIDDGPNGRGLFAAKDFEAGEPLLAVPLGLCVLAERNEAISAPRSAWSDLMAGDVEGFPRLQTFHEMYPLPWSMRASLALLDLVEGHGGKFWQQYVELLPAPEEYALPLDAAFLR